MNKMRELRQTITDYIEQGDNIYRIASVLNVPLELVQEIDQEVNPTGLFLTIDGKRVYQETHTFQFSS